MLGIIAGESHAVKTSPSPKHRERQRTPFIDLSFHIRRGGVDLHLLSGRA